MYFAQDTWKRTDALTLNYGLGLPDRHTLAQPSVRRRGDRLLHPGPALQGLPHCSSRDRVPRRRRLHRLRPDAYTLTIRSSVRASASPGRLTWASCPPATPRSSPSAAASASTTTAARKKRPSTTLQTPPFGLGIVRCERLSAALPAPVLCQPIPGHRHRQPCTPRNKFPYTFPTKGQNIDYSHSTNRSRISIYAPASALLTPRTSSSPSSGSSRPASSRRISYVRALSVATTRTPTRATPITQAGHAPALQTCG